MFDEKPEKKINNNRPPSVEGVLKKIIQSWHKRHKSAHLPHNENEAVQFWINHQEPSDEKRERTEQITSKASNDVTGWRTPYIDRVARSLRVFLSMNEAQKAYVIHCIDHGAAYRGEDFTTFKLIVEQINEMRKDPEKYISIAKAIKKQFMKTESGAQ